MNAIVAADRNWGIGKDNRLLVHLPGDLAFFREKTLGKTLVMGRETLESLPGGKPLPGRETILLTRNPDYAADCALCSGLEPFLERIRGKDTSDLFVAGGEAVYRLLLPYCDICFVTRILADFEADRRFPDLDRNSDFEIVRESPPKEENGVRYVFVEYRRKNKKRETAEPGR